MDNEKHWYLRPDVYVDPLVNHWYAWPNLIAPLTYAMYMRKTHRRLMHSFVKNTELHILANQDPSLAGGGEFVDCNREQLGLVQALLQRFDSDYHLYADLAEAIQKLDDLVRAHRSGESIEPLYAKVPDLLKGYVELHMDLYHQPGYRLIEPLLYRSRYYDESLQSMSLGILEPGKKRPFVLSTPRFPDEQHLNIRLPFRSPWWDRLFSSRDKPLSRSEIDDLFDGVSGEGGLDYLSLFAETAPPVHRVPSEGARLRYTGHAGFLLESNGCAVLVDPVLATRTADIADRTYSYGDLPDRIDYLCLTHNHADHVNLETLLQLRHKVDRVLVPKNNGGSLADPSLRLLLTQLGFKTTEVDELEEFPLPDGRLVSIPFLGEHGDLNIRSKSAWFFEVQGKRIYAGADSSNLEPRMYQMLHDIFGDLDVLAIGMECVGAPYTWLYGALNTELVPKNIKESRRLNGSGFEQAARMADAFRPKQVLIYALGMEPWYGYFMGLEYDDHSEQIVQSSRMVEHGHQINLPVERLCGKYELLL
ncbi:MAG: MBL fold metallo-hydrolase [Pseudomonadota bacterium]|nr:MBL fold metallo-hydrolase [Pseudomonadota bacterium]